MFLSRLRSASATSRRAFDLVKMCPSCGSWHAHSHTRGCLCCGGDLPEAVKKAARDFTELIALGEKQEGRLFSTFEFTVIEYPWPVSSRLHLTAVISDVSGLKQFRKSDLSRLMKIKDACRDCAVKLMPGRGLKISELNKAHIGFFKMSPLRLTCMQYLVPPLKRDIGDLNWLPLDLVLSDLQDHDRILPSKL